VLAAKEAGAAAVLLGHTMNDQAETVLLAMARGSGPRGLAGMPERRVVEGVVFLRPMLAVTRQAAREACLGAHPWEDPHNTDPTYARSRVRAAMPLLTEVLGEAVVANLARTAGMIAADQEYLDAAATAARRDVAAPSGGMLVAGLAALPAALRMRVLHGWCRDLGANRSALSSRHVEALDALVTRWRGQGPVALPGGARVTRRGDRLVCLDGPNTGVV
jgi:tRNA(Ile)-lysidine synthase